jgi:hypothetical protein
MDRPPKEKNLVCTEQTVKVRWWHGISDPFLATLSEIHKGVLVSFDKRLTTNH